MTSSLTLSDSDSNDYPKQSNGDDESRFSRMVTHQDGTCTRPTRVKQADKQPKRVEETWRMSLGSYISFFLSYFISFLERTCPPTCSLNICLISTHPPAMEIAISWILATSLTRRPHHHVIIHFVYKIIHVFFSIQHQYK